MFSETGNESLDRPIKKQYGVDHSAIKEFFKSKK